MANKTCKIVLQSMQANGHAFSGWWCETHRMYVAHDDKQCDLGRIDEATENALARIDLEVGRVAAEKSDKIRKALNL